MRRVFSAFVLLAALTAGYLGLAGPSAPASARAVTSPSAARTHAVAMLPAGSCNGAPIPC